MKHMNHLDVSWNNCNDAQHAMKNCLQKIHESIKYQKGAMESLGEAIECYNTAICKQLDKEEQGGK